MRQRQVEAPEAGRREAPDHNGFRHRVLFLADHLGMADGGVHGVTTYLRDVLPALEAAGSRVSACFLRGSHPVADQLRAHGVPVRFLGSHRFDFLVIRQVDEFVRRGGWNVLHCTQFRASVVGRAVARLRRRGPAAVLHLHDLTMPPPSVRLMNRAVASASDLGLCVSEAARRVAVRGYYLAPERVRVLYTGIETTPFCPLPPAGRAAVRRELGIAADAPVLCLVGRFNVVKGHREMIRLLQGVADRRPDCRLLLIGSGPEQAACEALARQLRLAEHIRFLGHRDDVGRILAAADVAVVPSQSEGLSRFAIEANLCGLPVVAYDSGGIAEVLADRCCGEVVPYGNRVAFIDAVDRALGTPARLEFEDARVQLARRRFGLAGHVRALQDCYESLEL